MKRPKNPARGADNPATVLTDDEVDMIRDLYAEDRHKPLADRFWTRRRLSEKFGVTERYVTMIVTFRARLAPTGLE